MRQTSWLVIAAASFGLLAAGACNMGSSQGASSPNFPMYSSPQQPAATGSISASTDSNGNTDLTIDVKHLSQPARATPTATTYVAWIVPLQGQAQGGQQGQSQTQMQNTGAYGMQQGQQGLMSGQGGNEQQGQQGQAGIAAAPGANLFQEGLPANAGRPINIGAIKLDSSLNGTLHAKTPFSRFEVLITPEPDAAVLQPTNEPVMVAQVNHG